MIGKAVSNSNSTFNIYIEAGTDHIVTNWSVGGSANYEDILGAPYFDGNWHLVTLVSTGTNMTIYVDGVSQSNLVDRGNARPASHRDPHQRRRELRHRDDVDDMWLSSSALTTAQVAGYYVQHEPHDTVLWDSDPSATRGRQPTIASCCDVCNRCAGHLSTTAPAPPGPASLIQTGAIYYAQNRSSRPRAIEWTGWSTPDWFETQLPTAPTTLYTNDTNAQTGAAEPTNIQSDTPHFSLINTASQSAIAQRTQVLSDPLTNVVGLWHLDTATGMP